ncbi:MAG: sulfur carrier protein ThiS [Candidatus Omnitrophica bacterium]|nr:sulfur carrier protein ThiS [Candidatus Omnitrophota bacterium]
MKIILNGQEQNLADPQNLNQLIQQHIKDKRRVVAEVNGTIIKSTQWESLSIQEGDTVELISFVGGG